MVIEIVVSNYIVELIIALKGFLLINNLLTAKLCKNYHKFDAWYIFFCTINQKLEWNCQVILLTDNAKL